jgi:glycine dehydrogenase subunit 1
MVSHPYIPNAEPHIKRAMLESIDAASIAELYADIPDELRLQEPLALPQPLPAESDLQQLLSRLLHKNRTTATHLSFLGGGCYDHYVPAVCDEINARGEFLTAYAGKTYTDHGKWQALFEFTSMMGELLEMDVVNIPTYDGYQAAATALRMAGRITQRPLVLAPDSIAPGMRAKFQDYCPPDVQLRWIPYDRATGCWDASALAQQLNQDVAAIFIENPSHLGVLEENVAAIIEMAHAHGALAVVYVNPITLGVLAPPASFGADIVCGDIQPLGIAMQYGGGHGGFIATHDDPRFVMEYPSRLYGIAPTSQPGEFGFGEVAFERTSFAHRENAREFTGTAANLWAITAGVYLALMGPQGMQELGETLVARAAYAMRRLNELPGVKAPHFRAAHFHEFVVNFTDTHLTVAEINRQLREQGIFGGYDLSKAFPRLGQAALYCITEQHTKADIDHLVHALGHILAPSFSSPSSEKTL